jgi:RNA 3'-terminal phosphate cyclase (ATP)
LLLQAILLPLALAEGGSSRLILRGGTHVAWSPPVSYVEQVWLPTLARIGVRASLKLKAWGWYPEGGGEVEVSIQGGAKLRGLESQTRGDLQAVEGVAAVSNLPAHIPQRICNRAINVLQAEGLRAKITPLRNTGLSTGAGLFLVARYKRSVAGFSALGQRGKPSEQVANEACSELLVHHTSGAAVDPRLADQLVLPLALADGPSSLHTSAITRHTLTVCAVTRQFIPRPITVTAAEGRPGEVIIGAPQEP